MDFFGAVSWAWFETWQTPSLKVYLLWDLIGQLAWVKRKDSEGHSCETETRVDNDKGGQIEGQEKETATGTLTPCINSRDAHKDKHTSDRIL